jgi:hypothetical protein
VWGAFFARKFDNNDDVDKGVTTTTTTTTRIDIANKTFFTKK